MTEAIVNITEAINTKSKILVYSLLSVFITLSLFYAFSIRETVHNAGLIKKTEANTREINLLLADLESRYLEVKNSVTLTSAQELGFISPKNTQFISLKSMDKIVSVADEI